MKRWYFFGIFACVVSIASCASITPVRQYETNSRMFTSSIPPVKVRLKNAYASYDGKSSESYKGLQKQYHRFNTKPGTLGIIFFTYYGRSAYILNHHNLSAEYMAKNWFQGDVFDTVVINGEPWVRVYSFSDDDYLNTGCLRREGNCVIVIVRHVGLKGSSYAGDLKKYRRTAALTPYLSDLIEEEFARADDVYEIVE